MRGLLPLIVCFMILCGRAFGQTGDADPKDGLAVECGTGRVVVFAHTSSTDGRYALAWTLRARDPSAKPVDWAAYTPETGLDWVASYTLPGGSDPAGGYDLLNGIIDLREKKFLPLAIGEPFLPRLNRREIWTAWSAPQRGRRYVLIIDNYRIVTNRLWLVRLDADGVRATDLEPAAAAGVRRFLTSRKLRNTDHYTVSFETGRAISGGPSVGDPFGRGVLRVPFDAMLRRGDEVPGYAGQVVIALPSGKITGVDGKENP